MWNQTSSIRFPTNNLSRYFFIRKLDINHRMLSLPKMWPKQKPKVLALAPQNRKIRTAYKKKSKLKNHEIPCIRNLYREPTVNQSLHNQFYLQKPLKRTHNLAEEDEITQLCIFCISKMTTSCQIKKESIN